MPVPLTIAASYQQALRERLARSRRHLLAGVLADTLTQATAALTEALDNDDGAHVEALRVAANHTSTLLEVLDRGAAGHSRPLPAKTLALAHALRTWAVTTRSDHRAGLMVVLAPPPRSVVTTQRPGPAASQPPTPPLADVAPGHGEDRPGLATPWHLTGS